MAHPILFIATGAFLAYIIYTRLALYLERQRLIRESGCKPCPFILNKDPLLGLDILCANIRNHRAHMVLQGVRDRFLRLQTNTLHSRMLTIPFISTCEPENVKTILSLKFKDFSLGNRKSIFDDLLGDGIFNSDGEKWANSRHLLRPSFARDQVADLDVLERHFQLFMKYVPRDGSTSDLQDLFFKLTIDTATEFLFNHSTNILRRFDDDDDDDDGNEDAIFSRAFKEAQRDALDRLRLGFFYHLRNNDKPKDDIRICREYVDKWVDDAIRWREARNEQKSAATDGSQERYVFIHELAKQTQDKTRIRNELMNVLLAGRDTTASLLSNMFFELAKRPDMYQKLRDEVAPLEGRTPTYEELKDLKYVKWCMNESLRLHPVVPGNSRLAVRDTVLPLGGGPSGKSPLFVPAGTHCAWSAYAMHRRTDIYGSDAEVFRPERWETLRPGWDYLPFNGGPRICLGQQYALTEAGYVTVRLVQEVHTMDSRDVNGGRWVEGMTLTCCSGNGTKVGLGFG